jgi:hypothetical protein
MTAGDARRMLVSANRIGTFCRRMEVKPQAAQRKDRPLEGVAVNVGNARRNQKDACINRDRSSTF